MKRKSEHADNDLNGTVSEELDCDDSYVSGCREKPTMTCNNLNKTVVTNAVNCVPKGSPTSRSCTLT